MKSLDDLREYFQNDLLADIKQVEAKRKRVVGLLIGTSIFILALMVGLSFAALEMGGSYAYGWLVLGNLILAVAAYVLLNEISRNRDFYDDFKTLIIENIVRFINPNSFYKSSRYIPVQEFVASHLFPVPPNKKYHGDDYVVGQLAGGAKLEFSELHAHHKVEGEQKTLFKGLFFVAHMPEEFGFRLAIVPKHTDLAKANFVDKVRLEPVEEDAHGLGEFYNVFADDLAQAQQFIGPELARLLLDFKREHQNDLYVSFMGQKIYVAIAHEKDLFEPKLFKTLKDFEIIREYYADLQQAMSIVALIHPAGLQAVEQADGESQAPVPEPSS